MGRGQERPAHGEEGQAHGRVWRLRRWLFSTALIFLAVIGVGLYWFSHLKVPDAKPLKQTTLVYDASGSHVIASFSEQNRIDVTLKQVPPVVVNAVVSTEEILTRAWDDATDPFTNAVRMTISRLRSKLGEPPVIQTVTPVGYRIGEGR